MLAAVALTFGTERNDGNAIGARARGGEMGQRTPDARLIERPHAAFRSNLNGFHQGFVAQSQCSAIRPFSMRNMSNHVEATFVDGSFGSGFSLTKLSTTMSRSATMFTSGPVMRGWIACGFTKRPKNATKAARPVGTFGLCWM